jgi:hypothetical protein
MATVTLGTTALDGTGFLPLTGDQTLVPGAQGGFHVWLKYRLDGMAVGKLHVKRTVRRVSDDALILTTDGIEEVDGMPFELDRALPSFMCPTPIGVRVMDEPVKFDVRFKSEAGAPLGEGTATATPRCPPKDDAQAEFCARICAG